MYQDDEYISNLISAVIEESKKENTILPVLKKDLSDVEKSIKNMLNAIQDGIYTPSTKQRLEELERRREQIEVQISMEELSRSQINEDMLRLWFNKMKNIDNNSPDYKHIFFHLFVNSVIVRNNGIEIILNYKDGTKIIPLEQMNNFFNIRSDVSPPARPQRQSCSFEQLCFFYITDKKVEHVKVSASRKQFAELFWLKAVGGYRNSSEFGSPSEWYVRRSRYRRSTPVTPILSSAHYKI